MTSNTHVDTTVPIIRPSTCINGTAPDMAINVSPCPAEEGALDVARNVLVVQDETERALLAENAAWAPEPRERQRTKRPQHDASDFSFCSSTDAFSSGQSGRGYS